MLKFFKKQTLQKDVQEDKKEKSQSSSEEEEEVKNLNESPKQTNQFLKALQIRKQSILAPQPEGNLIKKVDLNVLSNVFRRGGLLHAGMKQLQGDSQFNYEQILKKNIIDITQPEDAETCIIALRKINKRPEEIEFLQKALKNLDIFKSDGTNNKTADLSQIFDNQHSLNLLFKGLKHQFIPRRETIFNIGDYGSLYYIVLIGEVWTLIPDSKSNDGENIQKKKKFLNKELTDEEFLQKNFPGLRNVCIYKPGMAFGDYALLMKSKRSATMVCKEGTHVMTLSKQSFDQITGTHKDQILQKKLSFLKSFPFFSEIPNIIIMSNILQNTSCAFFKNKDVLYQENDPVINFYFIKSGEVVLSKNVKIIDDTFQDQLENVKKYALLSQKQQQFLEQGQIKRINYAFLGPNMFFGDEEYYIKQNTRQTKAVCVSQQAEIYIISKDRVLDVVKKHNQNNILKQVLATKWNRHESQLQRFMKAKSFNTLALIKAKSLVESKEITIEMFNNDNKGVLDFSVKRNDILHNASKKQLDIPQSATNKQEKNKKNDLKLQFTVQTNKILEAERMISEKMQEKQNSQKKVKDSKNNLEVLLNQRPDLIYGYLNQNKKSINNSSSQFQNISASNLQDNKINEIQQFQTKQDNIQQFSEEKNNKDNVKNAINTQVNENINYLYDTLKLNKVFNFYKSDKRNLKKAKFMKTFLNFSQKQNQQKLTEDDQPKKINSRQLSFDQLYKQKEIYKTYSFPKLNVEQLSDQQPKQISMFDKDSNIQNSQNSSKVFTSNQITQKIKTRSKINQKALNKQKVQFYRTFTDAKNKNIDFSPENKQLFSSHSVFQILKIQNHRKQMSQTQSQDFQYDKQSYQLQ